MKRSILFCFIFFSNNLIGSVTAKAQDFDRTNYYSILASNKVANVNAGIASLKKLGVTEKEAFEGTLLMKKAGLGGHPSEKLRLFKSGRLKLESAITKDNDNIEFRLLRVIIQEHAPRILKYNSEIEDDCKLINLNFKTLSPSIKQAIIDYSKTSKALKIS